jgi:hypothetical protein
MRGYSKTNDFPPAGWMFMQARTIMKKIIVEDIKDKMVLAKDVCGPSGNILLGAHTLLSESLGRRLKNWGITFVHIESEEEPALQTKEPRASSDDIVKSLKEKFSKVMDNPTMKKIFIAVESHFIQKGA